MLSEMEQRIEQLEAELRHERRARRHAELLANQERIARVELEARLSGEGWIAAGQAVDEAFKERHGYPF